MKEIIIPVVAFLLFLFTSCKAGGNGEVAWRSFDEGSAAARLSGKKIMLDVYTTWCGWCKKLDKEVYTNDKVAGYIGEKFIAIKLNAESTAPLTYKGTKYSEQELARTFGVDGYPTIIFLDSDGSLITRVPGFVPANNFVPILTFIGGNHYKTTSWEEYSKQQETD